MNKSKDKSFFTFLIIITCILFVYNLANRVNSYNATIFAFSYEYGFISRGFIGTLYKGISLILPFDLYTYSAINTCVLIITIVFAVLFVLFLRYVLLRVHDFDDRYACDKTINATNWRAEWYLVIFCVIVIISSFSEYYNFGRVDLFLCLISMLSIVLITKERLVWLIIPLAACGVMIHEGYVFMYLNIILALLIYKIFNFKALGQKKDAVYFSVVLAATVLVCAFLFVYFMFFSHNTYDGAYEKIVEIAKSITHNNKYHEDLVRAEILGVDLTAEEMEYRLQNVIELIVLLIMMIPFIRILFIFFKKTLSYCADKKEKYKYIIIIIAALTTLPLFIMKIDYGRWVLAVIIYYCFLILTLMALGDKAVLKAWDDTIFMIHNKWIYAKMLLAYMLIIVPFCDLAISKVTYMIYTYPDKIIKMLGV